MAPGESSQRIVQTRPGRNTGDTYHQTEDGRRWHTHRGGYLGTGDSLASMSGGRMHPKSWLPEGGPRPRAPERPDPNRAERRAALSSRKRPGWRRK